MTVLRMRPSPRRVVIALSVCLVVSASGSAGASATGPRAAAGCHPEWPVAVHHAGGGTATLPPGVALPIPCATATGYATSESSAAVTNSGAIFYSPAQTENSMARSTDNGATWSLVQPPVMQYTALWNTVDPYVVVDRRTGRIFWVHVTGPTRTTPILVSNSPLPGVVSTIIAFASGFQVYSTGDDGHTWTTADYSTAPMGDWEKIAVGPPVAAGTGAPQPTGYPDVVYVCANSPFEVSGPGRLCYRSLDGGATFAIAGYVFSPSTPAICPPLASNPQVVGPDGTLYAPMTCTNGGYVAVSHDEGGSFTWYPVENAPPDTNITAVGALQLAVDDAGNLYAMWVSGDVLQMTISRDHGQTWGAPLNVGAPGVHHILLPAFAAGPAGQVGLTYYGSRDASPSWYSAYITQTTDALAARPVFISAVLNDPAHPIYTTSGSPRADYVGGAFDAAGGFTAGLVKVDGPPPNANADRPTSGYVGRLVFGGRATAVATSGSRPAGGVGAATGLANTAARGGAAVTPAVISLLLVALRLRARPPGRRRCAGRRSRHNRRS